ncbi:hypothetical protein Tco_0901050 [Tanacetum coccineum]
MSDHECCNNRNDRIRLVLIVVLMAKYWWIEIRARIDTNAKLGDSQVKDIKIDLLVQQYEQFTILEEEAIDSGFVIFNTTITSLKVLYDCFSSKNYVRKFLRALHPKWGAKDSAVYKGKKERVKSIALKAKKESSNDETSTSGSKDKEYAMAIRDFKKFFKRKGRFIRQPCGEKKSFRKTNEKKGKEKDQKTFVGSSWSDSENEDEEKTNEETCLMAQSSNEVTLYSSYFNDNASSLDEDAMQNYITSDLEDDRSSSLALKGRRKG